MIPIVLNNGARVILYAGNNKGSGIVLADNNGSYSVWRYEMEQVGSYLYAVCGEGNHFHQEYPIVKSSFEAAYVCFQQRMKLLFGMDEKK